MKKLLLGAVVTVGLVAGAVRGWNAVSAARFERMCRGLESAEPGYEARIAAASPDDIRRCVSR